MNHVIGVSGGKDSVALALRLTELGEHDYRFICTPTGDELPEMETWWERLGTLLGKPLEKITNPKAPSLNHLIQIQNALPNFRQRWCTRLLKIEPTIAWCIENNPVTLYVGLRADEDEREGIYSDLVQSSFPFRKWGWGIKEVWEYLALRGVADCIPRRTDCARCYAQRLIEWFYLWRDHPEKYWEAAAQEIATGFTFRQKKTARAHADTWPVSLVDLAKEFERGRKIRGADKYNVQKCRVCSL